MFEKVNPEHPDKVADRIAGAIVDLAYSKEENPKIAVEVLIGHGQCSIIVETSTDIKNNEITNIVGRIAGYHKCYINVVPQDPFLSKNQEGRIRCGDNGIFKGVPTSQEENKMAKIAGEIFRKHSTDGKYIISERDKEIIICQSSCKDTFDEYKDEYKVIVNPLGKWIGGLNTDTGCTNRKLGSDMGRAVTGGGLIGKDLSKADVSVNIYCHLMAQKTNREVLAFCAIGDEKVKVFIDHQEKKADYKEIEVNYEDIVEVARDYVEQIGGFEKLAEWGLI